MDTTIQDKKINTFLEPLTSTTLAFNSNVLETAFRVLETTDFPTTKNEAWKYTRTGKISGISGKQNTPVLTSIPTEFLIDKNAITLVFENGFFVPELSASQFPEGLSFSNLKNASTEQLNTIGSILPVEGNLFNAINTAYATDGAFISLAKNAVIEQPIQLIHILTGDATVVNVRHFIQAGKFSKATFITGTFSKDANGSFTNIVTEINAEQNSYLTIDKIQFEDETNFQVSTEEVLQEADAVFTCNTLTLNGGLVRNNLNIQSLAPNTETHLNGAYLLKGNQHVDNHTVIDHKAANCNSNELYKGVIDEKATAIFNGKVFVRKDAQKINAFQSNGNVLLSDNATVNSKPELEIYADDVKCSHGSTTGQLDEEAVFYLRSRGITEKSARQLMVAAFIDDVITKIENESVVEFAHELIRKRFGWEF